MNNSLEEPVECDDTSPPILGCKHVLRLDMELVDIRKRMTALEDRCNETKLKLLEKELVK